MKINGDRSSAGFPIEKNDKPGRTVSKPGSDKTARLIDTGDELELTGKTSAIFNALRESNLDASESSAGELDSIRQKLAALTGSLISSPQDAIAAHANLDSETVARLVG